MFFIIVCSLSLPITTVSFASTSRIRSPIEELDRAEDLVGKLTYRTLEEIQAARLQQATVEHLPWSSDYWPTYVGSIAFRYKDPDFSYSSSWSKNVKRLARRDGVAIDNLSPAEKYDMLVGDRDFTLARIARDSGEAFASHGKVDEWIGICHGWVAASMRYPRPSAALTMSSPDGQAIRFYPADIKALASWIEATEPAGSEKMIGGKCSDDDHGSRSPACIDTNPGTWHLAVVQRLGVERKSMALDVDPSEQVWNQPLMGYSYTYLDPRTDAPVATLEAAKASVSELARLRIDRYRKYRSPGAATLVGISMRVTYALERVSEHDEFELASKDESKTVEYRYDLELDAAGQVIGGEWHTGEHPDFLWLHRYESDFSLVPSEAAFSAASRAQAIQLSHQQRKVSRPIIEALIAKSAQLGTNRP